MELVVRHLEAPQEGQAVEVVERKGLGHPDSICDALAEEISVQLCRRYLEQFGVILHHNVDKMLLRAGSAVPAFGGGEVRAPIELYLAGRATSEHAGEQIPVADIANEACRNWLRTHLHALDVDQHVKIVPIFRPGSQELRRLFGKRAQVPLANDTSIGAGFAPLTDLERVVLDVERALNSAQTKRAHPAVGEDIKVMGVRRDEHIDLTISCAMVGRFLANIDDYARAKLAARDVALEAARRVTKHSVHAVVNAADDLDRGDIFMTVTGTSAEAGDDGEVGRGNRTSGLITPYRPMTLEAAAGKNPVNHVGKLYSVAATHIAEAVVRDVAGVSDASCVLVSQIGRAINDPSIVDVRVSLPAGRQAAEVQGTVRDLVAAELGRFPELRDAFVNGGSGAAF